MTGASRPSMRVGKRALAAFAAGSIAVPLSFGLMGGTAFAAAQGSSTPPAPTAIDGVCPPGQVPNSNFPDTQNDFFKDAINCLVAYGVTQGYPDGNYKPSLAVNREQMALFFFRVGKAAGMSWNTSDAGFKDINTASSQEAKDAINALANAKVINGFTDGTYRPAVVVQRDAMAKFIANTVKVLGGPDLSTSTNDYYTDDAGDTFESFINGITDGKISNGIGSHSYGPGLSVARDAMAGFISRSMEVLFDAGKLKTQFPAPTQQAYTVSPNTAQTVNTSATSPANVQFSVSGVGTSPVDISLFNCSNVSTSNGATTFKNSTNPGGTGNFAQQGTVSHETITVVNGASQTAGQTQINGVSASNGTITFTVHNDGVAGDCVVPVVFQQGAAGSANQNLLPLNSSNQPSVPFGTGGATTFITQAPAGAFGGTGSSIPSSQVVATPTSSNFTTSLGTFTYKSSDQYQLWNSTLATPACVSDTYADFQARLSQLDSVGGFYNPSGQSVFCLNDSDPLPPASVTLTQNTSQPTANTASGVNTGGITVAFPSARTADASVTGYAIFRAQATPPANIGGSYTCPAYVAPAIGSSPQTPPPSPWAQLATVADVQAANAAATEPASYYYNDTTAVPGSNVAQPNEYCYAVSSQAPNAAGSTQTGTARTAAQNPFLGAAAQAASTAPTFTQLVQTSPTTAIAYYNQPINLATCDTTASTPSAPPFDYTAYVANGGVNTAQTISQVACANTTYVIGATTYTNGGQATITFANSLPAGTLVVTSRNGADGNTVCASGSTTNCQAVGQSVQTAAANAAPSLTATGGSAGAHSITTTWNQNVNHANVAQLTIYSDNACTTAVGGTNTYSIGDGTSTITITNPNVTTAGTDYILIGSGFVTGAVNGLPNGAVTCTPVTVGA